MPEDRGRWDQGAVRGGRIRRAAPLAGFAAKTAGEGVVAALRAKARGDQAPKEEFRARTAERYTELLGHSKGVLMKAGQLLSFVDAVPIEGLAVYQSALERLQTDAPPMDPSLAREVVESELGGPVDEAFAHLEPEPMAAASIGQVHEARLHDGTKVAVKVQYPGVDQAIRDDLANNELLFTLFALTNGVVRNLSRIDMRAAAAEISDRIAEELDYRQEAANIRAFADIYRGHPFIRIPEVIEEASADRILTMTFVEGMNWPEAREAGQELRDRWGEVLFRFALGSIRRYGLFNADPHPGNYRFGEDGTVGFVDFGCVKRFTPQHVKMMQGIVRATMESDASPLRGRLIEAGSLTARTAPPAQDLLEWYSGVLKLVTGPQPFTIRPETAQASIRRMYDPTSEWHRITKEFDMPPDFVFTTRIDLGLMSVLGELRATGHWRAITDELDGVGPPATELGEQDAAWRATHEEAAAEP